MPASSTLGQTSTFYCCLNSSGVGEALYGTATQASVWLLIEYPGTWSAQALKDSDIPLAVKEHLARWTGSNPEARLQLIRRSGSPASSKITVFLALPVQDHPIVHRWILDRYDQLLDIDLEDASNSEVTGHSLYPESLFLTCTNGRRDRCCNKFGLPVYSNLSALHPENTWETTHLGGHRFAANLLCFPHGLLYGRVIPADAGEIVRTYQAGSIVLEKFRGRVCLPEPAQAAEYFLRDKLLQYAVDALQFQRIVQPSENKWRVIFSNQETRNQFLIDLHAEPAGFKTFMNCTDEHGKEIDRYELDGIEIQHWPEEA
ncbi:MAG TPA: sucrase ferredoxin [Anaerolineales bacterium]|nr:sucrase ferredoxin [Anaerolineales bacterium]